MGICASHVHGGRCCFVPASVSGKLVGCLFDCARGKCICGLVVPSPYCLPGESPSSQSTFSKLPVDDKSDVCLSDASLPCSLSDHCEIVTRDRDPAPSRSVAADQIKCCPASPCFGNLCMLLRRQWHKARGNQWSATVGVPAPPEGCPGSRNTLSLDLSCPSSKCDSPRCVRCMNYVSMRLHTDLLASGDGAQHNKGRSIVLASAASRDLPHGVGRLPLDNSGWGPPSAALTPPQPSCSLPDPGC